MIENTNVPAATEGDPIEIPMDRSAWFTPLGILASAASIFVAVALCFG